MFHRRAWTFSMLAGLVPLVAYTASAFSRDATPSLSFASETSSMIFPVSKTDNEWRKILSPEAYAVLRKASTERPFTSPLLNEKREGIFVCAGCQNELYDSATKYESGTGWPSFWQARPNAVGTTIDRSLWMVRTEVHCARCGGHLGHIFEDGPKPTGMRHCINGVALAFNSAV